MVEDPKNVYMLFIFLWSLHLVEQASVVVHEAGERSECPALLSTMGTKVLSAL